MRELQSVDHKLYGNILLPSPAALGASFAVLPTPPALTAPLAGLTRYAASHHHAMLAAAWLEGTCTLLYVIFALALVHLAGPRVGLAERVTTLAAAAVLAVSLVNDLLLTAIAQAAALGVQTATALVAYGLASAAEHVFLLAPPLGLIPLRIPVLPPRPPRAVIAPDQHPAPRRRALIPRRCQPESGPDGRPGRARGQTGSPPHRLQVRAAHFLAGHLLAP